MKKKALSLVLLLSLCSCDFLARSYVDADRDTHDVIAPEYLRYVEADEALDNDQKARRGRTVEAWRTRIEKASR